MIPEKGIDRFMGVTPCALQSVGSSGTDRYYVRAGRERLGLPPVSGEGWARMAF